MDTCTLKEAIYSSESQVRNPGVLLRSMIRDLIASRELAWRFFVRDVTAQYRQTALGYFWAVFPPLVMSLAFILLNSSNVLRVENTGIPYPAYVIMGTVFFGLFTDALNAPLKQVNASKAILIKVNFPREALLLAALGQVILGFCIKLTLLVITLIAFKVQVQPTVLLVPVSLFGLVLLGMMFGVLLVPIEALFKDVTYGLTVITAGLIFLTPVAYPPPAKGLLATIMAYNPLTPLLMSARDFMLVGSSAYTESMLIIIAIASPLLFAGWVVFHLALPIMIERLGA